MLTSVDDKVQYSLLLVDIMNLSLVVALVTVVAVGIVNCEPKKLENDNQKAEDYARNNYVAGAPDAYRTGYGGGRYNMGYYPAGMGLGGGRFGSGYNYPYGAQGGGYNHRYGGMYGGYYPHSDGRYGGNYPYNDGRYGGMYQGAYNAGRYPYNSAYHADNRGYGTVRPNAAYGSYGYGYNRNPQDIGYGQYGYQGAYGRQNTGYGRAEFGRAYGFAGLSGTALPGTAGFQRHGQYDGLHDSFGGANVYSGRNNYYYSTAHGMPAAAPTHK